MGAIAMNAKIPKSSPTEKPIRSATSRSVKPVESALRIFLAQRSTRESWIKLMAKRDRLAPDELWARLIFWTGIMVAATFLMLCAFLAYAFVFVTQPIGAQAENDKLIGGQISTIVTFLAGSLGGILASNGLKKSANRKESDEDNPKK
jgi:hypothetical protein